MITVPAMSPVLVAGVRITRVPMVSVLVVRALTGLTGVTLLVQMVVGVRAHTPTLYPLGVSVQGVNAGRVTAMSGSDVTDLTEQDHLHLTRCVDLATEALAAGDEPFGSLLLDDEGAVRFEDRNRVKDGDATRHPEFEIARWAGTNLSPEQRAGSTVYTSGEHCPMCAAAHAWVGLGRIVYATSSDQLQAWHEHWGLAPGPVLPLPISDIAPQVPVAGPDPLLSDRVRALHADLHQITADG